MRGADGTPSRRTGRPPLHESKILLQFEHKVFQNNKTGEDVECQMFFSHFFSHFSWLGKIHLLASGP